MQRAVSTKGSEAGSTWRGEGLRQTGSHLSWLRMCSGLHDRDCMGRRLWEGSGGHGAGRWYGHGTASSLENRGSSCGTWGCHWGSDLRDRVCCKRIIARIEGAVETRKAKRRLVRPLVRSGISVELGLLILLLLA